MVLKLKLGAVLILGILAIMTAPAGAAAGDLEYYQKACFFRSECTGEELEAIGKKLEQKFECFGESIKKNPTDTFPAEGTPVEECLDKAEDRFAEKMTKAKKHKDCEQPPATEFLEKQIDHFVECMVRCAQTSSCNIVSCMND